MPIILYHILMPCYFVFELEFLSKKAAVESAWTVSCSIYFLIIICYTWTSVMSLPWSLRLIQTLTLFHSGASSLSTPTPSGTSEEWNRAGVPAEPSFTFYSYNVLSYQRPPAFSPPDISVCLLTKICHPNSKHNTVLWIVFRLKNTSNSPCVTVK